MNLQQRWSASAAFGAALAVVFVAWLTSGAEKTAGEVQVAASLVLVSLVAFEVLTWLGRSRTDYRMRSGSR